MRSSHLMLLLLLPAAMLCLGAVSTAVAEHFQVELESFDASYNIVPDDPHGADGLLCGLDFPGEWTRYELANVEAGTYSLVLKCYSLLGYSCQMRVTVEGPPGGPQHTDFSFVGTGTCESCGGVALYPAGSNVVQLAGGPVSLTLHFVAGGYFEGDWLEFIPVTAIEYPTWGAVKQFFR